MKNTLLVLFVAILVFSCARPAEEAVIGPDGQDEITILTRSGDKPVFPAPGIYPHPDDRTKFYIVRELSGGGLIAITQQCPEGTVFCPKLNTAVWAPHCKCYD